MPNPNIMIFYDYKMRLPDKAAAKQLAKTFGIEWDGVGDYVLDFTDMNDGSTRRIDVRILGTLKEEDANGNFIVESHVTDEQGNQRPVYRKDPRLHVDIRSTHEITDDNARQYLVEPQKPQHQWAQK